MHRPERERQNAPASGSAWLATLASHAARRPDHPAIVEIAPDGAAFRSINFGRFWDLVRWRAGTISARFDPGATIIAALPSGIDLASWMGASVAAGMRLVLMHPRCIAGECRAVASKAGAVALLSASDSHSWGDGPCVLLDPRLVGEPHPFHSEHPQNGSAPGSFVLGTSGTTGLPMLAQRESAALDADARAVSHGLGLGNDDVVLCAAPMSHSYGVDLLLGVLFAGATLRVMPDFDAEGAARQLESGVSVLPGVPFIYESLARLPGRNAPRVRLAISAGSTLGDRVRHEFTSTWKIGVGQLYGATELGTIAIHRPDEVDFDPASVGRPLPGVSARVLSRDGAASVLPTGEEGHLAVRAPSMLSRYLDGDIGLVDGHFLTGDLARIDAAGRVHITGRLKLLIDVGGFKVNTLEVEAALMEHSAISDCAVGALNMSDTIRRVRAWYVVADPRDDPGDRELRSFLKDRLSSNKIPRLFERVERLPRTPLGKLMRDKLPGGTA